MIVFKFVQMMENPVILTGSEGSTIEGSVFAPPKSPKEQVGEFEILESNPSDSTHETIQLAIRYPNTTGDLFRVDSYKEGYFSSYWLSSIDPARFLELSGAYFREFEQRLTPESEFSLTLCASWLELPEIYTVFWPLTLQDFRDVERPIDDPNKPFTVVRLDNKVGDICYMPKDRLLGLIAEPDKEVIAAAARLANGSQPMLSEEVVRRTLTLLPYSH